MKDPKFEVRKQAIYYDLKTKHGDDPRLIPALIDVIKTDPELKIKIMAVDKLGIYTKHDAAVEELIKLTDHETAEIKEHAMRSLYGYGSIRNMSNTNASRKVYPLFIRVLKDPDRTGYFRTRAIQPAIDALASENTGNVKKILIQLLANTKDPSALPVLVKTAFDKYEPVRKEAAKALKEIDKHKAFVHVASIYEKGDEVEKERAAWAMGYLKNNQAIDILIKALDGEEKIRRAAAWSLAQIGGSKANKIFDAAIANHTLDLIAWGCDYYIRRGKADSEDIIIQALQQHGVKITAVSMLNSGNKKLYQAAKKWAKKKGYSLVGRSYLTFGSKSISWGSKRK